MKYFDFAGGQASRVAQGCMRIGNMSSSEVDALIKTDLEHGINFFDHADIYGRGVCEEKFGEFLENNPSARGKIMIQTKCAIKPGISYDFSKDYILSCVDKSLKRLNTDHIDVLLLHRPDALCEPEEVAEAFEILHGNGKVRFFGVSNHNPMQIRLLQKYLGKNKIIANQLQFSIANSTMIDAGINVNMENDAAVDRDGSVLDFCRLEDITVQPWSPFQGGYPRAPIIGNPDYGELNNALSNISEKYGVTPTGMLIAWILRHPAKMQPIIGTTDTGRVAEVCAASDITITHDEWYDLYRASGKKLP
ncbi:MAG: aldo/keto reductase [Oscillospiraceae bacterium]|nr:aldo/keto reductase [Oscillospiraceae bacterium]